jgi:hypothetical protein
MPEIRPTRSPATGDHRTERAGALKSSPRKARLPLPAFAPECPSARATRTRHRPSSSVPPRGGWLVRSVPNQTLRSP